jgi:hypothetical protein
MVCAVALFGGLFTGAQRASAAEAPCPNQALRTGPSAQLPDCRGYEMVSPSDKNGYDVLPQSVAAAAGSRIALRSFGSFAGGDSAGLQSTYLAGRERSGAWSTRSVTPPIDPFASIGQARFLEWSPNLSKAIVQGAPSPQLTPDAVLGTPNLYLRDNGTDSFSLVSPGLRPIPTVLNTAFEPSYGGASADFSHVVFGIGIPLTQNTPADSQSNIYEEVGGQLRLIGILPGGEPSAGGAILGSGALLGVSVLGNTLNAVSENGSRIFFTALPSEGLFVRVNGTETFPVSRSQRRPLPNPNLTQPATYWTAAADGSAVFFTSRFPLTNESNTGPTNAGNDLYRFDVDTFQLTDLSVGGADPNGAEVLGVVGASMDGAYVYFVAKGQLDGNKGTPGAPNLYLAHAGSVSYIATLGTGVIETLNWTLQGLSAAQIPSRVSPDGREMLITTSAPQPGHDNRDPVTGVRHKEIYRYDADLASTSPDEAWTCVSCKPSGEAATGDASLTPPHNPFAAPPGRHLSRAIDDNHRPVFFNSDDALVPQDVNQTTDVYQWRDGQVTLISTGTSPSPSYFADADRSGENVYIATRQQLVPADRDDLVDIYDARIGGGTPTVAPPPAECAGGACRGPGSSPAPGQEPASSTFQGPGNVVKKPAKRKAHKKKHRKRRQRRGSR